jgi:hypothetical protein
MADKNARFFSQKSYRLAIGCNPGTLFLDRVLPKLDLIAIKLHRLAIWVGILAGKDDRFIKDFCRLAFKVA